MCMIIVSDDNNEHAVLYSNNGTFHIHTLKGSNGSGGGGVEAVLTAQNMQPRVQVSPSSMIVPVPPLQHSPMLGHCASSQTV